MAKTLHHKGSGKLILRLNDRQYADLRRLLEEESTTDRDYYVDDTVIDHLEKGHADPQLVKALKRAIEDRRSPYRDPATVDPTMGAAAGQAGLRPQTPEPTVGDGEEGDGIDVEWRDAEEGA